MNTKFLRSPKDQRQNPKKHFSLYDSCGNSEKLQWLLPPHLDKIQSKKLFTVFWLPVGFRGMQNLPLIESVFVRAKSCESLKFKIKGRFGSNNVPSCHGSLSIHPEGQVYRSTHGVLFHNLSLSFENLKPTFSEMMWRASIIHRLWLILNQDLDMKLVTRHQWPLIYGTIIFAQ